MMNLNYKNEYNFSTILLTKLQSLFRFYQNFLPVSSAPGSNIRTHIAFLDVMSPWKWKCSLLSPVRLFATPWTVAHQAPLSMAFPRQECWNGLPFPSPEDLPNPWIKPGSPTLQACSSLFEPPGKPHVSLTSPKLDCSSVFYYLVILTLKSTSQLFFRMSLHMNCLICFSWLKRGKAQLGGMPQVWCFLLSASYQRAHNLSLFYY